MALAQSGSIDVVIPARGIAPWLQLSLESIASQTLKPKSIFVVDDGFERQASIADIGRSYFGPRFRLLKNQGRGISAALNTAIQKSSAEWIARMDADDVAHPQRLQKQLEFLTARSDDVIGCGTQVRFINGQNVILGRSRLPTTWDDISRQICCTTSFVHPTLMIRREMLLSTPYRSPMDGAEDVDLVLRLAEKGEILNLNEVLLDYRLVPDQESFRARARHTAVQELAFRLARARRKTGVDPLAASPELADKFLSWRLSDPIYIQTRSFLTAARYMAIYLHGFDAKGFFQLALASWKWFPVNPSAIGLAWRVARHAGAALLNEPTPFAELN